MSQQLQIKKATRQSKKVKIALIGVSGSGKTFSALAIAKGLGEKVLVIDTEHGSASAYSEFNFDTIELESFAPQTYVECIHMAEDNGYDVVILDSLSHAWTGKDGSLEQVDKAARKQSGNSFGAWRDVTPHHNNMIDAIVGAKCHVIATMRAKTEYITDKGANGKMAPRKVGLAPIQRDGMEYEFDLVMTIDQDHQAVVTKSRIRALSDQVIDHPGAPTAKIIADWLALAPAAPAPAPVAPAAEEVDESGLDVFNLLDENIDGLSERYAEIEKLGGKNSDHAAEFRALHAEIKVRIANGEKRTPKPKAEVEAAPVEKVTPVRAKAVEAAQSTEEEAAEAEEIFGDKSGDVAAEAETPAPAPAAKPAPVFEPIQDKQKQAIHARARKLFGKEDYEKKLAADIASNMDYDLGDGETLMLDEFSVRKAHKMTTIAEIASKHNLKLIPHDGGARYMGANPYEPGATEDGFHLFPLGALLDGLDKGGCAWQRTPPRFYNSREVAKLEGIEYADYEGSLGDGETLTLDEFSVRQASDLLINLQTRITEKDAAKEAAVTE